MFLGKYTARLDWRMRFTLPGPYVELLRARENEPRHFYYMPQARLAIYTDGYFVDLVRNNGRLKGEANEDFDPEALLRVLTIKNRVPAQISPDGLVQLPRKYRRMYGFSRGRAVRLAGCGDHIELWPLRPHGDDVF